MNEHDCEATRQLNALSAHIDALCLMLVHEGHMTPHARSLLTQTTAQHSPRSNERKSRESKD